jgi:ribosomal protein S18 acetylase RimI-like enzyme
VTQLEISLRAEADLTELFWLANASFAHVPGWSQRRVAELLSRDIIFVARERAQTAGYVALQHNRESRNVVIEHLLVAPGHERHGVGRRLLAYAEGYAIAEGAPSLQVVAEEDNWRARSFYRRSGFVPVEPELMQLVLPRFAEQPRSRLVSSGTLHVAGQRMTTT